MWVTKVKAKCYLWFLAVLACLGIPLVASHSPRLQTKRVSRTIHAHMLPLISSAPAVETTSLKQVSEINRQNANLKKFYSSLKKKKLVMDGIFRGALKLSSTPRAGLLPILQGLWWLLQLDWHGKGSPTLWMTVFFRIRETLCFPVGNLYP